MSYHNRMATYQRPHVDELVRLLTEDRLPPRIVAITGPRQSGKTTIVRQALRRMRAAGLPGEHIAVDDPEGMYGRSHVPSDATVAPDPRLRTVDWLVRLWKWGRERAWEHPRGFVLALDEIQVIPEWSGAVKGLWDRDRDTGCPLRVVILGSAPWALLTGRGESLAGRFIPFDVRHWSLVEMVDAFDFTLDEYTYFGGYPGAAPLITDLREWRRYVVYSIIAPVSDRDILALTRVDKPGLMRQLVDLAPEYSGQIVRYDHLVGRLRATGHTTTIAHYLGLLSDAGIVAQLSKYSGSAVRRSESSPKLNVLNTGLMTAKSGYSFDQARADRTFWGRLVESAVGAHLHNTLETSMRLAYWRDGPHEVDFVLSQGPRVLGIEVKSGRRARSLPGLAAFEKRFPRAWTLLVAGTGDAGRGVFGDQTAVPINEFLAAPASHWLEKAP
ncbi:MAG: ATP-binding protein [Gemmatimonadetes bacterium]|nr:ATP-binding protein [Gemmatimonadota bacterium]